MLVVPRLLVLLTLSVAGLLIAGVIAFSISGTQDQKSNIYRAQSDKLHSQISAPSARPSSSPTAPRTSTPPITPSAIVIEFFQAINSRDWNKVWLLGGKYLAYGQYRTLAEMIYGYICTKQDVVTELHAHGNVVQGTFIAYESFRGIQTAQKFTFLYDVSGGAIKSATNDLLSGKVPHGCPS